MSLRRKDRTVRDGVIISYRGASYEIGRGPTFYGIWGIGQPWPQPLEWWPDTVDGWYAAWSRFVAIERPETIVSVAQPEVPMAQPEVPVAEAAALVAEASGVRVTGEGAQVAVPFSRSVVAGALLAIGVACGIVGLFPDYLNGASLAQQPFELVPHVIYFALWTASALLVLFGRGPMRVGALLGTGTCVVTFGLFFADAGTAIAGGAHVMGAGLVLGLVGWLACLTGSTTAFVLSREGAVFGRPRGSDLVPFMALSLAALGTAAAFAPSWDSYVLQTAAGATESFTAGNVFSNPAPVIAGNVAVMVALVAVAAAAVLWRPILHGAVLLAGAILPMVGQAISALIQIGEHVSPSQFGISSATAARTGLTITSGLTVAFWVYCVFLLALMVVTGSAILAPSPPELAASQVTPSAPPGDHHSPTIPSTPSGLSPLGPEPPNAL